MSIETSLKPITKTPINSKHFHNPKCRDIVSNGFGTKGSNYLSENSIWQRTSSPYLTGDIYCNHLIQTKDFSKFTNNPANNRIGIRTIGASYTAISD